MSDGNDVGGVCHPGCAAAPATPRCHPVAGGNTLALANVRVDLHHPFPPLRWVALALAGLLAALGCLVVFPGCNTPFIPLPPPADPTFTPVAASDSAMGNRVVWETRGAPSASTSEARVYVFNLDAGSGVIVRAQADGSYVANPLEGKPGDRVQLHYQTADGRNSPDICRVLEQGLARTPCTP
jgi:hypothetical protein